MNGYGIYKSLMAMLTLAIVIVASIVGFIALICHELSLEAGYRQRLGEGWQLDFEKDYGSLARAHTRMALAAFGIIAISSLAVWLYRILRAGNYAKPAAGRRSKSLKPRFHSRLEYVVRYRRNAVLGIYFGLPGIAGGVFLIIFRFGLFADPDVGLLMGILVFLCGYCGVLTGCWWWLKAKEWSEGIVFIGLMPLAIFFIPFVRLIVFAAPGLLLLGMVLMPIILIVVVFLLPDKAEASRRKPWWDRD